VFASTRQIYGVPVSLPVDEDHPTRPVDVNGINKLAGESYHILYHKVFGIPACALRLTNTYGPRMRVKDARQTFLGTWIRLLVEGRPFEVWDGAQLRDFTYVDDAVEALLLAAGPESNGGTFNLSGEAPVSLKQLADVLIAVNGGGEYVLSSYPADRKRIDIGDYYADSGRIRRAFGWTPRVGLGEGLERTLDYYRKHLDRYR
jgi:UDP-glucose 4-epimerase